MSEVADVVIVGGGVAGGAAAAVLAARGLDVVVLERQHAFRDRVRGENMAPWGVVEMRRLGLEDVLTSAGGGYCTQAVFYDELVSPADAEAAPLSLTELIEGVPGSFSVGHPQACKALLCHAELTGAVVVRGVEDVKVTVGRDPSVGFEVDGSLHTQRARLVIAADGRQSTVRRQLGIELHQVASRAALAGLLVHDDEWPTETQVLGTEGDVHFFMFPRPNGLVRLYLARDNKVVIGGASSVDRFLRSFQLQCCPPAESLMNAEVVGPCASYPGTDSWTDLPFAEGVVFVGDAAGWSDPIIGQGLAIAMRDVRMVADTLAGEEWSVAAFEPYATERSERMRRLRLAGHLATELRCTFSPAGRQRRGAAFEQLRTDARTLAIVLAPLVGPDAAQAEAFTDENIQRILSLA